MDKPGKRMLQAVALITLTTPILPGTGHAAPTASIQASAPSAVQALIDKGVYWYDKLRLDLASQSFNRVLLIDPNNATALRWQGMIDLARGDAQAAGVWLKKLQSVAGANHPGSIELQQSIELGSTKRQRLAELRYLADSERAPADLSSQLLGLFPQAPVGEAALQVYRIMSKTPEGRTSARQGLQNLARQFPQDTRYPKWMADLGLSQGGGALAAGRAATRRAAPPAPVATLAEQGQVVAQTGQTSGPELSNFEQGQMLNQQAQAAIGAKDPTLALNLFQQAVALNPTYPWFRFDLANALVDTGDADKSNQAKGVMDAGLQANDSAEMRFAAALLATRQNRTSDALALLNGVPRNQWSDGMSALDRRINYGQYLANLRRLDQNEQYNLLAGELAEPTPWRAEPEVFALQNKLNTRKQVRLRSAFENATIEGTQGVSNIESTEIPVQLDIPLDFERSLFVRLDQIQAKAGQVNVPDATNFAQLGTTTSNNPAISSALLNQNFKGQLIGVGLESANMRLDLGSTVGDIPVNSWVGGIQWKMPVGDGSLRIDLARRMVGGSVLSSTGAIDPLTGQSWGGARRNGVSAVYYNPITPTTDFVGIARANRITGKHIPDNTEMNLQGILSRTVYQTPGHKVEVGGSLYLWSFEKNLRFYTYGQGGYYSPQAFGSLTFPITWTGNTKNWSWRIQASVGASESREDATDLYPLDPQLAAAAALQNNSIRDTGGPGGGTSTGLRAQIEHQLMKKLVIGAFLEIDRSEGYNPDRMQVYLKYSFGDSFEFSVPPESVTPYSRF